MLASGKWVNFGFDKCTEISLVWNQLIISDCFEACGVRGFHLQEICAREWFCILPRMRIVPYQKFFISCYITFKKKALTCGSQVGHMWVTSALFSGSVGQEVWPTFNPAWHLYTSQDRSEFPEHVLMWCRAQFTVPVLMKEDHKSRTIPCDKNSTGLMVHMSFTFPVV